jgi:hypothetical protein
MRICDSFTRMLLGYLTVASWNSESSKLVPHFWLPALAARCLDLIWRLLPLRLKILSTNLIILLATQSYPLLVNHSYGFGPRENRFERRRFGYSPRPHRGDHFPRKPGFLTGGSFPHFKPRHLDGSRFPVVVHVPLDKVVRCKGM